MSAPKNAAEVPRRTARAAIEPPHDLWAGIEARLKERHPPPRPRPPRAAGSQLRWLAAAAMVASVAVGVWIGRDLVPLPHPPRGPHR